jgi:hypothetical protein
MARYSGRIGQEQGGRVLPSFRQVPEGCVEEGEIEEFFDHLWWFPSAARARVSHQRNNLFWIHRDVWESGRFLAADWFPVQEGDTLSEDPK